GNGQAWTASAIRQRRQNSMVRIFTSFIFGVAIVPSPCSMSVQAIPRQPSSHARLKPTGPPPTMRTGVFCMRGPCSEFGSGALIGAAIANLILANSFRLDLRCPDHFAPFPGFVGDEPAEVGRRARKGRAVKVGKPRLDLG